MNKRLRKLSQRLEQSDSLNKELFCEITVDIESSAVYFLGEEEITEQQWLALGRTRKEDVEYTILIEGEQDDF